MRPRGAIARPKDKPDRAANLEATVKSIVVAEIHVPQVRLANLYADPKQNSKWMDDIERIDPISGELGLPGSKYRLVPKKGDSAFVLDAFKRFAEAQR